MAEPKKVFSIEELTRLVQASSARGPRPFLVAVDGRCGAGKTTIARALHEAAGWPLVHADDFFLQPQQRTPQRYAAPGENMDHERLEAEVLQPLRQGRAAVYRRFDCQVMAMGETLRVEGKQAGVVIEGSYTMHPSLRKYYDLMIFVTCDVRTQKERLVQREGQERFRMFAERWIPLEEKYFAADQVEQSADVVMDTSR
jgi:uridine kinase